MAGDHKYAVLALSKAAGSFDPAAITEDKEPNDTFATARPVTLRPFRGPPGGISALLGDLQGPTDTDIYKVTIPPGAEILTVAAPPIGAPVQPATSTYGSTLPRFAVTIKKADGTILGDLAPPAGNTEKMSRQLFLPVSPGEVYILRNPLIFEPEPEPEPEPDSCATNPRFVPTGGHGRVRT